MRDSNKLMIGVAAVVLAAAVATAPASAQERVKVVIDGFGCHLQEGAEANI